MLVFKYTATNKAKKKIKDTILAKNPTEARKLLTQQGYNIQTLKQIKEKKSPFSKFKKGIPILEKATLFRYLATMVSAGLSLPDALEVYSEDSQYPQLKQILHKTQERLQQGKSLSEAFAKYPELFDVTTNAIIKSGELSGNLTTSLNYLAKQLYSEYQLKQKVKGAMMYPVIIVGAMGGVGMLLIFFVLPKIAPIFLQMDINLPLFSRVILKGGLFVSNHSIIVLSLLFGTLGATGFMLTRKQGRIIVLKIISLIPAIKHLLNQLDLARFCRTLATLLSSGVPIGNALLIVMKSLSQIKYTELSDQFQKEVQKGRPLSDIMRGHSKLFPNMVSRMVATGEKTGSIDNMLSELADHYEKEIDSTLNNFTSILEPVLLLLVGIGVGIMVLAVIAPIYSLVGGIESVTPGR